jgi:hypothetical protein
MNATYLRLVLTLGLATVGACDSKEQCVADCDATAGDATAGDDPSGGSTDDTGVSLECSDNTDAATMFIEQNNACDTMLDCTQRDSICYNGPLDGPCGAVGLSVNADFDAWAELMADLESCECGAAACGSDVMCNDQGRCVSFLFSEDYCPNVERDIETFLAGNRSCETAADCKFVESTCHVDDCSGVALNVDADVEGWTRLDAALGGCEVEGGEPGQYCNYVGACAFEIICTDQGQCAAQR